MTPAPKQRFSARLNVGLLLPVVLFVLASQLPREWVGVAIYTSAALSLIAVVIAIRQLARPQCRTSGNFLVTLLGAIPLVFFAVTSLIQATK